MARQVRKCCWHTESESHQSYIVVAEAASRLVNIEKRFCHLAIKVKQNK